MSSNKSLALAICLTITGCAQTPQSAEGGHWWSFGSSDKVAEKDTPAAPNAAAASPAPAAKDAAPAAAPAAAKAEEKPVPLAVAVAAATNPTPPKETHWWWPFGGSDKAKDAAQPAVSPVPMPDPKVTQAWLDEHEPRLRAAIQDTSLKLERRENVLVVIAPIDGFYNPKRPEMLLPVTLGPFSKVAKTLESDPKTAVLVLGHGDNSMAADAAQALSQQRAQSVAAIFRLSGLQRDRLILRGMGSVMPRAANDSSEGSGVEPSRGNHPDTAEHHGGPAEQIQHSCACAGPCDPGGSQGRPARSAGSCGEESGSRQGQGCGGEEGSSQGSG